MAGIYTREPNTTNEIWLQDPGTNAIWPSDEPKVGWNFGSKHDRNTIYTIFYSHDDVAGPQLATNWEYDDTISGAKWNGDKWYAGKKGYQHIESDDISVNSLGELGTYINTNK